MITDVYGADAGIATVARAVHTNASVAADAADSQGGNNQSVHVRSCPLPSVTVRFAAIYTTARVCGELCKRIVPVDFSTGTIQLIIFNFARITLRPAHAP